MKSEQITVNKIIAEDGMILTDGSVYGKEIFLGSGRNANEFYEITEEEYASIIESQEENTENDIYNTDTD